MTNKERLEANNEKIAQIQKTLKNKILTSQGDGEYFVKVIDYDGTILKEARLNAGDTFMLPNAPSHDGLVFQEWSCSQEIVDNTITIEDNNVMVGATYTTASGLNEFDIELTKSLATDIETNGFVVTLRMDGTKDWGDGTSDDLTTHTYYAYGKYTIKCNGTTMSTVSGNGLFAQTTNDRNYYCIAVRLANVKSISMNSFSMCLSLKTISISNTINTISNYAFSTSFSLESVVFPNSFTKISSNEFQNCYSLKNVVIPNNVTSIGSYAFNKCYSLKNIVIPKGVKVMSETLFYSCYSLENLKIPKIITSIGSGAFRECYSISIYDFSKLTAIPSLSSTSGFTDINKIAKIIVPDALYDEWIVATNWSFYAKYIYKASEVQE